jgi:ParB-like chromosome segregation protein Spo0J
MAGRMGTDRVTIKNLIVVDTNKDDGLLAVSGPVPGASNRLLIINKIGEGKLSELIEEVPQVEVQQVEEEEGESDKKTGNTEGTEVTKSAEKDKAEDTDK